jgi:hypothetical protein
MAVTAALAELVGCGDLDTPAFLRTEYDDAVLAELGESPGRA